MAGLVATLRTSPLGAICAGMIFTGASVTMYLQHDRAMEVFTTEWKFREFSVNLASPLTSGVLAFAGGLLLVSVFSVSRWRGRNSAADAETWSPLPPEETSRWPRRTAPDLDAWAPTPAWETSRWPSHAAPDPEAWHPIPSEETYGYR